ncbi:S8 family serine peptidase [Planctomycetota bacterium]
MRSTKSTKETIKRWLHVSASSETRDRIWREVLFVQEQSGKTKSALIRPNLWRIIMKSPLTKLTAAAVMLMAALPFVLFFIRGATPVYALEQTIEANHTIKTIHLRIVEGNQNIENNEFSDCWIKYDDVGLVSNFRCNIYEEGESHAHAVWNEGVLKIWRPSQNVVIIIRVNDMEKYWEHFAKEYDPKLIFQWLYVSRENAAAQLQINELSENGHSVYVTATHSIDKTRLELIIDPKTKLVKELSRYRLGEQEDDLETRIEVLAYNEPIDPSMFKLSGISHDALLIDQVDQLVGLEQGHLTNHEIVAKVVRETLEATIAKDYEKVSRLMEGVPGDTIQEFIEEEFDAGLVRVTAIGQPEPHERSGYHIYVPCEIEVENEERGKWTVNIITMTELINYQTGRRWVMHRPDRDNGSHISTNRTVNARDRVGEKLIVPGERVGDFRLGISKDEVLKRLGKPKTIFLGRERYTLNNLPNRYYMAFSGISFSVDGDIVTGITAHSPHYKFTNGLKVGDSEQKIKQTFGEDFRLQEGRGKDFLFYKDKGLHFEIHKQDRTVMEINVTQAKRHQRDRDVPDSDKAIMLSEKTSGPITFPKIDRKPKPSRWNRGEMKSLPKYDPNSDNSFQVDLRCRDLSKLDLSNSIDDLLYASFDDRTVWPANDKMPHDFTWQKFMELGKNPGLGVRRLHEKGITGRGVRVAILDQPLLVDHQEYAERVRLYEEIGLEGRTEPAMHGAAVASIAVGKTVGVAPEAELYYIGKYNFDRKGTITMRYIAQGIDRILEINEQLPKDNKIRVISISRGWGPSNDGYDDVMAACEEAKAAGIFVVSCSLDRVYGFQFHGLGRHPSADPDLFESYEPGLWWAKGFYDSARMRGSDRLLIPMDSRTTASPCGSDKYVFYRQGGWSWSVPYIAVVYALAAQVEPDITPERFWDLAMKTGRTIELEYKGEKCPFGPIIDPVKLIGSISEDAASSQRATSEHTIVPGVRIGVYTLDMRKDDVLKELEEPEAIYPIQIEKDEGIRRGEEKCSLNNLPEKYILSFRDVSFWMEDDSIEVITVRSPLYKLSNGLGVGDSEQKIKKVFGENFKLEKAFGKDFRCYHAKGFGFQINKNQTVTEIVVYRPEGNDRDHDSSGQEVESQTIVPGVGMGDYTLDMNKDDVLRRLGKPNNIHYGGEDYTLDNLPNRYFMFYDDISFFINEDTVTGIATHNPRFKFANGLKVGDSQDKIVQTFGKDFELEEFERMDTLTYKDKGLYFEINKENGTVEEISVNQAKRNESNMNIPKVHRRDDLGPYEDVSGKDLRGSDLRYSEDILDTLEFNQETHWPPSERLPEGFDPKVLLKEGMNPGLGVRALHARGITGVGVHVGLIDQPLLLDHPEYDGKIASYHSDCGQHKSSMHGPAMASQLVGKRCGTAPGASLHVVAVPSWKADAGYYAKALDRLVAYNQNASQKEKIRVVSVSCQPSGEGSVFENQPLWDEAVQRAQAKGILVLDCTWHHGFISLCWLDPEDRENVEACTPGFRIGEVQVDEGHIHVPSAPRTAAEADEDRSFGYAYDGGGRRSRRPRAKNGYSDTIPYAAGILALGWQIRPDLTPERMKALLFESAHVHESGAKIIHPAAFINLVRGQSSSPVSKGRVQKPAPFGSAQGKL